MRQRRRTTSEAAISQDRWLLSYADFITLLFALFVVLFAAARHGGQAAANVSEAIHSGFDSMSVSARRSRAAGAGQQTPPPDILRVEQQLRGVLAGPLRRGDIGLQQTPDGLVISLREIGFFNTGEAALLPGAASQIDRIGGVLLRDGLTIRVEGHSDDQPIHNAVFQSNWELSAARAMTVLLLLVDTAHYDPTRISMAGYGRYRPVADNRTPEGRRLNRRVDLVILARH